MPAPILETPRLRLRGHVLSDMEAFATFFKGERAALVDSPQNKTHLWYGFTSEVGSWDLMGFGGWAIETRDGQLIGQIAITHPPHFPEREIGWILFDGFEGQGFATEAARTVIDWATRDLHLGPLISYINAENSASRRVAERLGAYHERDTDVMGMQVQVWRHLPGGRL